MPSLLSAAKPIVVPFNLHPHCRSIKKVESLITIMSWACSKCTFSNPSSQKLRCQICLSEQPQSLSSLSISPSKPKWSCAACTFLNPYRSTTCEICGSRASASLLSTLEVDDDDLDQGLLGSSIGSVFLPLKTDNSIKKGYSEKPSAGSDDASIGLSKDGASGKGLVSVFRPCGNKRKDWGECSKDGGSEPGGGAGVSSGFRTINAGNKALEAESLVTLASAETHLGSESKTWKILSYNVWFREDLEMHKRMLALGNLIELHLPDFICFQEVTPNFYEIFQQSGWWKQYCCSISDNTAFPGPYFCMQLCKLPVKSYTSKPFDNSIMGRELCIAEVEVLPNASLVVATSHLESPCPSPPKWDQMFSKERVDQAKEAVGYLKENQNVIFCGDMNWDDKLDGPFPLADEWIDAWTELRPGEVGWTKSNKMLCGNRTLQKRLDRFVCKLKDFKVTDIIMIGMDAIQGLSHIKEKRVKSQVKELVLPVLPSDHFGLLLTIALNASP